MTSQQLTTATEEKTEYTRCACHAFEIQTWTGEVPEGADPGDYAEYEGTGCTQMTHRTFAPGHDAKLKSLLIKAGAVGSEIVRAEGGVNVYSSAEQVATHFGFEHQVLSGIQRAKAKAAERAEKKAAKAKAKADKPTKAKPVSVRIKVGRHEYDATIDPNTNDAMYTSAKGESKTVAEGKYKLVDAK